MPEYDIKKLEDELMADAIDCIERSVQTYHDWDMALVISKMAKMIVGDRFTISIEKDDSGNCYISDTKKED